MATYTPNLNLKKPEGSDYVLVGDLNQNMDKLDGKIGKPESLNTNAKGTLVDAINEANQNSQHQPKIQSGTWWVWDAAQVKYVNTGIVADLGDTQDNCEAATQDATEAAQTANASAQNADQKASNANNAASAATTAAGKANTAATNADQKASAANTAATNATNAATAANNAAENADEKASAADTAAGNANTAADEANDAADNADSKASAAQTAAGNAQNAADKINNMTVTATQLAEGSQPTVNMTLVNGAYRIAFGIPKGDTGATPQITFQVATGAPGTNATATIQPGSTAENPIILLTIPRGDTGSIDNLTINGKQVVNGAVTLTAADINGTVRSVNGKAPDANGNVDVEESGGTVKSVNNKQPDAAGNVTLGAGDVGARPNTWMPSASDVGARPDNWMPTAQDVGAATQEDLDALEAEMKSGYVFYINTDRQLVVRYAQGTEPPPLSIKERQLVYTIA